MTHFEDQWLHVKKPIIYDGKETIELIDDVTAHWGQYTLRAKAGYVFDGASIPRLAWRVVGHPFEEYLAAALFHDLLYDTEHFARETADEIFLDLMKALGVGFVRRRAMYLAVRATGGVTWIKHTKESKADAAQYLEVTYA